MPTQQSRNPEPDRSTQHEVEERGGQPLGRRVRQLWPIAAVAGCRAITTRGIVNISSPETITPGITQSMLRDERRRGVERRGQRSTPGRRP